MRVEAIIPVVDGSSVAGVFDDCGRVFLCEKMSKRIESGEMDVPGLVTSRETRWLAEFSCRK